MPLVFAKSKLDREHVEVKKNIGCDGIEYQMLASDFDGRSELVSPALCLSVIEEHPAHAIHLPMNNCNIEDDLADTLEYITQLAEHSYLIWASRGENVEPVVVTHNETHFEQLDTEHKNAIAAMMYNLLEAYPHVHFAIENTTPLRWLQKQSTRLSSGYFDSPVLLADYLRRELQTERIGTCLDTCHAKITRLHLAPILHNIPNASKIDISLAGFFELYRPTAKLFHFASFDDSGYGSGHATPYTKTKMDEMRNEVSLYRELEYDCPITLEINERDLLVSDGYKTSSKALRRAWKETM